MLRILQRKFILAGIAAGCLIVSANALAQQSSDQRPPDDFGDRLNAMIEKFVKQVNRELTGEAEQDTIPKRRLRTADKWNRSEDEDFTYDGDVTIEKDETVNGNVVVKGGDLTVYGEIIGDVLVVGGTLYVKDGGLITGDARVISGDIVKDDGGVIEGSMDRSSARSAGYREPRDRFRRHSTSLNANWVNELTTLDNFIFRYNRVEGIFLGAGSEKRYYWDGYRDFSSWGSIGYGFKSKGWRYNIGIARQFPVGDGHLLELAVEGHRLTDTKDHWVIGLGENTAAAFLIHEDYRDYFYRAGWDISGSYSLQQDDVTGQFKVAYLADKYLSMENRTEWALFGGDKRFRLNPMIDNGNMKSILVSAGISTVDRRMYGQEGWSAFGTAEFAEESFGSDFAFRQYTADIRRYQPLSRYDNLNLRFRIGTSEGFVPLQKLYEIGGLSTVQVLPFKELAGNRMLLLNAEYIVNGDFLHDLDFWPSWLMRGVNFVFIGDAGWTRAVSSTASFDEGFGELQFRQLRSNLGIGLGNRSGTFRIAYLWSTDGTGLSRVIFRVARPF
ncbi:MAG: hypothetical protein L0Y80_04300 [Ignavibacteriae bacterium]|nr:hypothetical protein [Ignavibacteriota bacterium]